MCDDCINKENEVSLPQTNFILNELKLADEKKDNYKFTPDEVAWYYNLYNRVFKANKQPGCGKCFATIRKQLSTRYKALSQ
jgi:hypothetical protein